LTAIVKAALIPGSIFFLLVGLLVGLLFLHLGPRPARWGRRWLIALGLLYTVLSMPIVSHALIETLQADYGRLEQPSDATTVAVIGAGVVSHSANGQSIHAMRGPTAHAVLEAARVYKVTNAAWVIASGGIADPRSQTVPESQVMRDELIRLGVPAGRILVESASRNTAEQIANLARMLRERQLPNRVIVVTTPVQSRRVMLLARREHIEAVPALTTELQYDSGQGGWRAWRPSVTALRGSESATYEYLAAAQAWLRR
jgi:uncharacterized SAM-binding protein YcdF (DUF218 family)